MEAEVKKYRARLECREAFGNTDYSDELLFEKHSSKPYNPKLANTFFKSGMIEAWGRGFDKIRKGCEAYEGPLPEYDINVGGVMVLCRACDLYLQLLEKDKVKIASKGNDLINDIDVTKRVTIDVTKEVTIEEKF